MKTQDVRSEIQELESLRKQAQFWRLGSVAALLAITLGSLTVMRNSVNGLLQPGPSQDEFATQLSTRLQESVVPQVQALATQTLVQMRPEVEAEVGKLNERVPELSDAFLKEMEALQTNVPKTGQKVLEDTLGAMLLKKESDIKTMFPDATDDKIKALIQNVNQEAATRILGSQEKLFSKPMQSLNGIVGSLQTIHDSEKVPAQAQNADWEMVSAVVDLIHDDMQKLKPDSIRAMDAKTAVKTSSKPANSTKNEGAGQKSNAKEVSNASKGY